MYYLLLTLSILSAILLTTNKTTSANTINTAINTNTINTNRE